VSYLETEIGQGNASFFFCNCHHQQVEVKERKNKKLIVQLYEIGFYLLEQHLNRLEDAMKDFQKLDSTLFPNKISRQTVLHHLNDKVPQDGNYQRVSFVYLLCMYNALNSWNQIGEIAGGHRF